MKKRWRYITAALTAAAVCSGMAGWGQMTCLAKETAPAEPLMYGIGSTSKVVTAAAVMKLADEELIDIKKPLTTYIPEFEMADERYRRITPEMLLDHSSGLPAAH